LKHYHIKEITCRSAKFYPALETIAKSGASASDIIAAVSPSSPMDWINTILLLDQMPRNCFRGDQSKMVFKHFDREYYRVARHLYFWRML
jgi:uncharacterized protein (DUF924 family)